MWYQNSTFYQIYPLGLCGAPAENDGVAENRIGSLHEWIPHLQALGVGAVYFCPVFSSDAHGYDTRDYRVIDERLGTNADFAALCGALHGAGVRVVLDGVFNHVGRGFWAFQDVCRHREASAYRDWFHIDFGRDNARGDGFWYEGWEGHDALVKLNLHNPQVVEHLFACIRGWVEQFGIDGLRLDVAYLLDPGFLRALRRFCDDLKPDFFLVGETIHGDYTRMVGDGLLHSCTNYECYKGIHSSLNDGNLFEIAYSLNRQFGPEHWTLYKGLPLMSFVDNHDVPRIASILADSRHLRAAYALLFGMPGIPCIYYGSEWGVRGEKRPGSDAELRPHFAAPAWNELTDWIAALTALRAAHPALSGGDYRQVHVTNRQLVFSRSHGQDTVIVAVNIADEAHTAPPVDGVGAALTDLLSGKAVSCEGGLCMPPFSAGFFAADRRAI